MTRLKTIKEGNGKTAFLWALILSSLIFLPIIIYNRGIFVYMGDFNVQQIPFYKLAHEAVRSGNIFWSWTTDLGADFIGSYSFYLLFSPFFWLTIPFPTDFLPYLMGPLLILKTSCAALTSYFYIKRFVRNNDYAVLGSILYAFSGFMTFNIFFNHFHDVVVFFPLLLIALEELVQNDKRGYFAAMVAVSAIVNYWFFIGEVVFVIIYVITRMSTDRNWRSFVKFALIAFESVVGVLMAAFVLMPSALAVMGNPRAGSDDLLTGQLMWIYGFAQRLPAIIQSFFFPPEVPSRPTFFPDMGAKWASLSAWLPLFSTVGTIAYIKSRKKDFAKRIIVICMIMSLIPILNSAFVLFNSSYYARWFYMPILFLVIATVSVFETRDVDLPHIKSGFYWTSGIIIGFIVAIGFSPKKSGDTFKLGLYGNALSFWCFALVAVICLILCAMLIFFLHDSRRFLKITSGMLSVVIVCFSLGYMISGKSSKSSDDRYIDTILKGKEKIVLPSHEFCRSDFYECDDNLGMQWGLPNIQAFHSIVPPSIMEFYPYVGVKRDVSSKPSTEYEALRPLLSVKWLFIEEENKNQDVMSHYTLKSNQNGYNIYENDNFIPMGFCYSDGISKEKIENLSGEEKVRYMLSALVLEDDCLERNGDILNVHEEADYRYLNPDNYISAVNDKKANSAYYFKTDNLGFTAKISSQKEALMFFSVPNSRGFTAFVNGTPTAIEKANVGFMAVRIPKGEVEVRFNYMTPGLKLGLNISAVSIIILILYLMFMLKFSGDKKARGNISQLEKTENKDESAEESQKELLDKADSLDDFDTLENGMTEKDEKD